MADTGGMADNLFTMLSAYRQGSGASPFENYCTSALAYFLQRGHRMLNALIAQAAGTGTEELVLVEVQPRMAEAGVADLLLTYEGGKRVLIEVQLEPGADESLLPGLERVALEWVERPAFLILSLRTDGLPAPWVPITWMDVLEAVDDDRIGGVEFGSSSCATSWPGRSTARGSAGHERLYALGGAAVRRFFGEGVALRQQRVTSAHGHFRYLGTTFAPPDGEMKYWIGVVTRRSRSGSTTT